MTDKKTEALKLAQEALEELLAEKSYWWQEVERDIVKALEKAESICKQALAEQPAQQEPVAIYYMRDNHTFKKLSANVSTALVEIEQEFNEGYTHGTLCSKRKGFRDVHASGSVNRMKFFADCKAALEQWLPKSPPAQRKPLTDEQILRLVPGLQDCLCDPWDYNNSGDDYASIPKDMIRLARAIEAAHGIKEKNT